MFHVYTDGGEIATATNYWDAVRVAIWARETGKYTNVTVETSTRTVVYTA